LAKVLKGSPHIGFGLPKVWKGLLNICFGVPDIWKGAEQLSALKMHPGSVQQTVSGLKNPSFLPLNGKVNVSIGEWEKIPHLQVETLV